jgi:hypothetical protein
MQTVPVAALCCQASYELGMSQEGRCLGAVLRIRIQRSACWVVPGTASAGLDST